MENIRKKLATGSVVYGTIVVSSSPVNVEISGYANYDFTFIDTEHASAGPYGKDIENLIRAAYAADIAPFCRVTHNSPSQIKKCLDFGAKGIIAPFINNKKEAQKFADACYFSPKGTRGGCPGVRAQKYGAISWFDFVEQSNDELIVMPVIESMEAIDNLEPILSVEGINAALFGPFDLSIQLGVKPEKSGVITETLSMLTDNRILDLMDFFIKTCIDNNVFAGNIAWDVESAIEMSQKGCKIIAFTTDNNIYFNSIKQYLEDVQLKTHH